MHTGKSLLYQRFTIQSDVSADDVLARINKNTLPRNAWKRRKEFPDMNRPYQGYTSTNFFEISKITGYRKEIFHPLMKGNISSDGGKTIISVQMQPFLIARVGLLAWLVLFGLVCMVILWLVVFHPGRIAFNLNALILTIPFLAFALVCYMALSEFKSECRKSKQFLITLLNGKEVSHSQH